MLWLPLAFAAVVLAACNLPREAQALRLRHEVTVETPQGERTYSSVVSLRGYQSYNYHPGSSGWGAITGRLTGTAVRIPLKGQDFYVLLTRRGTSTPAWFQMELIKDHFAIPNYEASRAWIGRWNALARSSASATLRPEDFPDIAVLPAGGWMDDARILDRAEAEALGLKVTRYRLIITREQPVDDVSARIRYRPTEARYPRRPLGRDMLVAKDATA